MLITSLGPWESQGAAMSQSPTHIDEEDGHLQLRNPPAQALSNTPAKAQVPEVGAIFAFFQPASWVKLIWVGEVAGFSAHGIDSRLHQCLRAR